MQKNNESIKKIGICDNFPRMSKAFTQGQFETIIDIPCAKPDLYKLLSASADINIINSNVVKTSIGKSSEGKTLTGKKMIVNGQIEGKIEYIAYKTTTPVHSVHFKYPFSEFIVLDSDSDINIKTNAMAYIEDIFVLKINKRQIFYNTFFILNAFSIPYNLKVGTK